MKHGSRNAYNEGCRCERCTAALAAHAWARRKVEGWEEPLRVIEEPVITRDGVTIPSATIAKVMYKKSHQIKMKILEEVWKALFKRDF